MFDLIKQSLVNKQHIKLSKEEIKKLQQDKFHKLTTYVAEHSLYYQKIIKKHNIDVNTCAPEDFPPLTKADLIEHFNEIVTDSRITKEKLATFLEHSQHSNELFLDTYFVIHTSGSSGTIGYYVYTQKELIQGIAFATRVNGINLFQKLAYVAATKGHFAGITMVNAALHAPLIFSQVRTFDINSPFTHIIQQLNTMQPTVISGYAFALRKLAEAQKEGQLHINPTLLQSGGEPLATEDKLFIQQTFKAPVANIYASSEHLLMGIGRDSFGGMYLMEDNLIFDMQPDCTYVTNLFNYTLPLIRYQMSDRLEPIKDTTNAMPFTKVKEIVGRNEYVPIFTNDKGEDDFISPILLVEFYVEHLTKFQFHLKDKSNFVFKACLEKELTKEEKEKTLANIEKKLQTILNEKQMRKVKFTIDVVDTLWADPKTGKFRLITKL